MKGYSSSQCLSLFSLVFLAFAGCDHTVIEDDGHETPPDTTTIYNPFLDDEGLVAYVIEYEDSSKIALARFNRPRDAVFMTVDGKRVDHPSFNLDKSLVSAQIANSSTPFIVGELSGRDVERTTLLNTVTASRPHFWSQFRGLEKIIIDRWDGIANLFDVTIIDSQSGMYETIKDGAMPLARLSPDTLLVLHMPLITHGSTVTGLLNLTDLTITDVIHPVFTLDPMAPDVHRQIRDADWNPQTRLLAVSIPSLDPDVQREMRVAVTSLDGTFFLEIESSGVADYQPHWGPSGILLFTRTYLSSNRSSIMAFDLESKKTTPYLTPSNFPGSIATRSLDY